MFKPFAVPGDGTGAHEVGGLRLQGQHTRGCVWLTEGLQLYVCAGFLWPL